MSKLLSLFGFIFLLFLLGGCSNSSIYLSFDADNNESIDNIRVTKDTVLPSPEKTGYVFSGWYIDQTFENEFDLQDYLNLDMSNIVIKLYAKWTLQEYQISYILDGGENTAFNPTVYNVSIETTFLSPTKAGYLFQGWYNNPDYEGDPITSFMIGTTGDKTLYAKWTSAFTVSFDSNGGTPITSRTQTSTDGSILKPNDPIRSGFIFYGWYLGETDNNGMGFTVTWPYTPTENITVYARWMPVFTITFDSNGGSTTPNRSQTTIGGSITQPFHPTRLGYQFEGWYLSEINDNGTGTIVSWPYTPTSNVTMYAKWTPAFTVIFDSNGGTTVSSVQSTYGEAISQPSNPTRTGFIFDGWYFSETDDNGTGTLVTWPYIPTENITVYAKWRGTGGSFSTAVEFESTDTGFIVNLNTAGDVLYFKFTPTVSDYYTFYSTGDLDTIGDVYNSSYNLIASDDDSGSGTNFSIEIYLYAGQTYYLTVELYNSTATGTFNVYVGR